MKQMVEELKWKKKTIKIDLNENDKLVVFNLYGLMKPKLQNKIDKLLKKVPSRVIEVNQKFNLKIKVKQMFMETYQSKYIKLGLEFAKIKYMKKGKTNV